MDVSGPGSTQQSASVVVMKEQDAMKVQGAANVKLIEEAGTTAGPAQPDRPLPPDATVSVRA